MAEKKLPRYEDFLAPWQRDADGKALETPEEIDAEKAKRLIYNLTADKARLTGDLAGVTAERDTKATELATKLRETESADQTAARERDELKAKVSQYESGTTLENMRLRAAINAGLDSEWVDRLRGTTQDELNDDAEALAKKYVKTEEPAPTPPTQRPRAVGHNPGVQAGRQDVSEWDLGKQMARQKGIVAPEQAQTG